MAGSLARGDEAGLMSAVPALLLDRDGVIIENRSGYIRSWADVAPLPGSIEALARIAPSSLRIVIVTNQSAIGRGLLTLSEAQEINRRLVSQIEAAGGRLDRIFLCPHHPDDDCDCRKPRPGLFLQAAEELGLDLERSVMVGDTLGDLQAAHAAGVGTLALVRTGLGRDHEPNLPGLPFGPVAVFDDLAAALAGLLPLPD
jgi:D-glycero-D-manno-heptose 1,7-bisphosphate phosphatase